MADGRAASAQGSHYRPDIDGLRAIAVASVLAFHAFPLRAPGGFAGVDVFFVISGFLITRLVDEGVAAGRFSFASFYGRRVRRLFPALLVVIVATMAVGWVLATPDQFAELIRDAIGAATFSANFVLWRNTGYFGPDAATKPLLHLWSLGVEEQFYLVWPSVMVWTRGKQVSRLAVLAGIWSVSLALYLVLSSEHPLAAFYAPWTRLWELCTGALVASGLGLPASLKVRGVASVAGLGFLLSPILWHPGGAPWPLIVPVVGTAGLIAAGETAVVNRRILAWRPLVLVGLVSYPLYLWHWPLLVYTRAVLDDLGVAPGVYKGATLAALLVALLAAVATYRLVERPIRRLNERLTARSLAACMGGVALLLWAFEDTPSFRDRDPAVRALTSIQREFPMPEDHPDLAFATGDRAPEIVILGDSHAEQYFLAFRAAALALSPVPTVAFNTRSGCPFLRPRPPSEYACHPSLDAASAPSVRVVVIGTDWTRYLPSSQNQVATRETALMLANLRQDIQRLRALGKIVVIIGPHPTATTSDPALLTAPLWPLNGVLRSRPHFEPAFSLTEFRRTSAWVEDSLAAIARATSARLIMPADYQCHDDTCPAADSAGVPLWIDDNHLRPRAVARYLTYIPSVVALAATRSPRGASDSLNAH